VARLNVGSLSFDAGLVVFDKDGTLIDFEYAWGRQTVVGVERLIAAVPGDADLRRDVYRSLGYDPRAQRTDGTGPLATASIWKLRTIVACVLYQHGFTWDEAEARARDYFEAGLTSVPLKQLVRPVADLKRLVTDLFRAQVRLAVVTTDDRSPTLETLELLGIADQVDFLACGDDQIPLKPAPDAVLHACAQVNVAPARTLVVGDTIADMLMARRAGAGLSVAVLSGVGDRDSLADYADVVLDSVGDIRVSSNTTTVFQSKSHSE
jgi:phosphoglycolate phosphatase